MIQSQRDLDGAGKLWLSKTDFFSDLFSVDVLENPLMNNK